MMVRQDINFELIAFKLGDAIKWGRYERTLNEIDRIGKAVLRISKREFRESSISSERAQSIYSWVKSLEGSRLLQDEKIGRFSEFIRELLPEESKERAGLLKLLGEVRIIPERAPDFASLLDDSTLGDILSNRWLEAQKCLDREAHLATIIMMGSLLEGVLLAVINSHPRKGNAAPSCPKDRKTGKPKKFADWKLREMINVAHECGWLQRDIKDFSQELRDYRNMVHPWHQRAMKFEPDEDTCDICWRVVRAAVADLAKSLKRQK